MKTKRVRMLLIGAGFMGKTHLDAARQLGSVKYAGVADVHGPSARKLARRFGLEAFADPAEAVKAVSPDAVDLCVPTPFHRPLVSMCARQGVNVLCEKPIALTKADAMAIKTTASKHGIRVMVGQLLRFWPEYAFAVETARSRKMGRIRYVECRRLSPPPDWNDWMLRADGGGGAVLDLQIHDMDFIQQLLGRPAKICADGVRFKGAINAVSNRLEYSSGAVAEVNASFIMPPSYPFRMTFRIEFEKGVIEMDFWRPKGKRLIVYPERGGMKTPALKSVDPFEAEIDYFAKCLRSGKPFSRAPLNEAISALEMCLASRKSCATRQKR